LSWTACGSLGADGFLVGGLGAAYSSGGAKSPRVNVRPRISTSSMSESAPVTVYTTWATRAR
jgi:hypothetical protein